MTCTCNAQLQPHDDLPGACLGPASCACTECDPICRYRPRKGEALCDPCYFDIHEGDGAK